MGGPGTPVTRQCVIGGGEAFQHLAGCKVLPTLGHVLGPLPAGRAGLRPGSPLLEPRGGLPGSVSSALDCMVLNQALGLQSEWAIA